MGVSIGPIPPPIARELGQLELIDWCRAIDPEVAYELLLLLSSQSQAAYFNLPVMQANKSRPVPRGFFTSGNRRTA